MADEKEQIRAALAAAMAKGQPVHEWPVGDPVSAIQGLRVMRRQAMFDIESMLARMRIIDETIDSITAAVVAADTKGNDSR